MLRRIGGGASSFGVEGVDSTYTKLKDSGLEPELPRDGEWGERYFHMKDPDAHELSFAEPLSKEG